MSSIKSANISSVIDLSQAIDEKLTESLTPLGYNESFTIIDTKLAIGYVSAIIAGGTFYLEKKFKFNDALPYSTILVVLYFILSAVNWYYNKFVAKSIIYKGKDSKGNTLEISGDYDKHILEYNLAFKLTEGGKVKEFKDVLSFPKVFDSFGILRQDLLDEWVSNSIKTNITNKTK